MIPQQSGNETNIKLPLAFILASFIGLISSQGLLLANGDMVSEGVFRIPAIWSAAHLLILGWALLTAMGAMYQLVPVAFLTPIWSEKFGYLQFIITVFGIGAFSAMLYFNPGEAFIPGVLTLIGILMFLVQMLMTLRKQAKPNILTLFVGTALVCLLSTIILGIMLAWSLKNGAGQGNYQSIFHSHLLLGTAGWFTLLIFGFSYKMVPMFSLSHGYTMKLAGAVYGIYVSGLVIVLISFWNSNEYLSAIGLFLLSVGFLLFAWHIKKIIAKRIKKKLDKPFMFALSAVLAGTVLHLAAFAAFVFGGFATLIGPMLYLYLLLWIAMSILGYLYKIVPFLWWTHKYSGSIGKKAVPALKDMINDRVAVPLLSILAISSIAIFTSIITKQAILFNVAQAAASLSLILISVSIISVLRK